MTNTFKNNDSAIFHLLRGYKAFREFISDLSDKTSRTNREFEEIYFEKKGGGFSVHRIFILIVWLVGFSLSVLQASRIKDLTGIEGERDNQLIGFGIVVGLDGKGEDAEMTKQTVFNLLKNFGLNLASIEKIKSKNSAMVMVTANIGPFVQSGTRIDVTVSSIGDAKAIQGGVLLQTPLRGANGVVYAVAQGAITVGGFIGGGSSSGGTGGKEASASASVQKNHPTVGMIAGGAIVEREIKTDLIKDGSVNMLLINPDFTTAVRVADAINRKFPAIAQAKSSTCINVKIPTPFKGQEVNFLASVGSIETIPDTVARVVINERTGTIVATSTVRISTVAISQGSLTITIANSASASQPSPLSNTGETAVLPKVETKVVEEPGSFWVIKDFPTIDRLANALNAMGVSTRDMMSIMQSLKSAGALQAELIIN